MEARESSFSCEEGRDFAADEKFEGLTSQIGALSKEIRKLKIKVEEANHSNFIDTPEGKMGMAEAIHYVGDMRSELSSLEKLRADYKEKSWGFRDEKRRIFQVPQKELLAKITALEKKKVRMDSFLSSWNWKVNLKD
ncbi:hypothetical protein COU37_01300 [Candidatus Micrarchaeota archaeon CG10_big_fil_rev_8_21_14_0_10_45_29]|nr:MAG: hypothetical protein COU37_01300 [Candidatus Micrarchaeota archaeon CG10_big_fil_rev_8_21_14_0_10_45_29]